MRLGNAVWQKLSRSSAAPSRTESFLWLRSGRPIWPGLLTWWPWQTSLDCCHNSTASCALRDSPRYHYGAHTGCPPRPWVMLNDARATLESALGLDTDALLLGFCRRLLGFSAVCLPCPPRSTNDVSHCGLSQSRGNAFTSLLFYGHDLNPLSATRNVSTMP